MRKILDVTQIFFKYPDYPGLKGRDVLEDVSFEIKPGEICVIAGGPESGKSTLAGISAGLIPLHTGGRLSGQVFLGDTNVLNTPPAKLVGERGIVFQDPEKQIITTVCGAETAFPLESLGVEKRLMQTAVTKALESAGLAGYEQVSTSALSGGEKKKLGLAGLFAVSPGLWILDETIEELDKPTRHLIMKSLRDSGAAVILFTSKFLETFDEYADSLYILKDRRISVKHRLPASSELKKLLQDNDLLYKTDIQERILSDKDPADSAESLSRPVIETSDISYQYPNADFAVSEIDLHLSEGEVLALAGRNGCGKSTLARVLCGLLEPGQGAIKIDAQPADSGLLNRCVAYMFQNPDYQIFLPTVEQELSWGLREAGFSSAIIHEKVNEAAALFKLPAMDTPPAMMSFSARKRLQAAVYYLLKRRVFILDEADTGLSFREFTSLLELLKKECSGIILITHNIEVIPDTCNRVICMDKGRISCEFVKPELSVISEWFSESGGEK